MQSQPHLLQLDNFFESGYNGIPWSTLKSFESDIFYHDTKAISATGDLKSEVLLTADDLKMFFPNAIIVDDNSLESQIYKLILPGTKVIPIPLNHTPSDKVINDCQRKYLINDPEMIFAISLGIELNRPLLFSRWGYRIVNANSKYLPEPYFVYIENERTHRFLIAQKEFNLSFCWNFLKFRGSLLGAYFRNSLLLEWLRSDKLSAENNYFVERKLLYDLWIDLGGTHSDNIHKIHWPLGPWTKKLMVLQPEQQASYPIHIFYEKVLGIKNSFNSRERALYG